MKRVVFLTAPILGILAGGLFVSGTAHAALNTFEPNADFSTAPVTISEGDATFTFTMPGAPITDTTLSVDAVATTGSGMVNATLGTINGYSAGATLGPDVTPGYSAFAVAAGIPYSAADDFIGLSYTDPTGIIYGYAEVNGGLLASYAFDSSAGTDVVTGAIPEPASLAVLGAGLLGLVGLRRRA